MWAYGVVPYICVDFYLFTFICTYLFTEFIAMILIAIVIKNNDVLVMIMMMSTMNPSSSDPNDQD